MMQKKRYITPDITTDNFIIPLSVLSGSGEDNDKDPDENVKPGSDVTDPTKPGDPFKDARRRNGSSGNSGGRWGNLW